MVSPGQSKQQRSLRHTIRPVDCFYDDHPRKQPQGHHYRRHDHGCHNDAYYPPMHPVLFSIGEIRHHSWWRGASRRCSKNSRIHLQRGCFEGSSIKLQFSGEEYQTQRHEEEKGSRDAPMREQPRVLTHFSQNHRRHEAGWRTVLG